MLPRPSLLVIEDDPYAQRLLGAVGERAGFAVASVSTGAAAEDAANRIPFDIIIVDLKLPDAEGFELIERLRSKPQLTGVPFLVCTGNVTVDNVVEARRLGALEFIRKPIDLFELKRRLEKTLDLLTDRWIQPASAGQRTSSHRRQDTEAITLARTQLAAAIELLDHVSAETDQAESSTDGEAALSEAFSQLRVVAPEIGATRLNRLVVEFAAEPPDSQRRKALHVALRVALTSLDQRLAS
jgi:DNA-binding response OmpR family regulator